LYRILQATGPPINTLLTSTNNLALPKYQFVSTRPRSKLCDDVKRI